MIKATATQVRNHFGEYIEKARRTPVVLQRNGQDTVVILDAREYKRLSAVAEAGRERAPRFGFGRGLITGSFDLEDDSHLVGFEEYMP